MTTPHLALPHLVASQAQKEITHNEALTDLDVLVQLSVISRTLAAPPASPADGDAYVVGSSPTGAWEGRAGQVAFYASGWRFKTPKAGWLAFSQADAKFYAFDGTAWALLGGYA